MTKDRKTLRAEMKAANKAAVAAAKHGDDAARRRAQQQQDEAIRQLARLFPDGASADAMLRRT